MTARRIVTGLVLCLGGLLFALAGFFIWQDGQDQLRLIGENNRKADEICRESLQKLGEIVDQRGGVVWELKVPVVSDSRAALGDASVAIAACPTRVLEYFCLGSGCSETEANRARAAYGQRRPVAMDMRMALRPGLDVAEVASRAPAANSPAAVAPRPLLPGAKPAVSPSQPAGRPPQPHPAGRPPLPQRPALPAGIVPK